MPVRESPAVPLAIPPGKRSSEKHGRGWRLRTRMAQAGQAFSQLQQFFRPPVGFLFTLRTTLAALIALGIAFWMELDSPAWAPLTVWVVAQPTRGESLSKARWRIVGTLAGGMFAILLSAVLPQAPWLFFIVLALWTGLCTGCASFATNFRAYAWSLAGFTGAIIAVDAAPDANHVFPVAMSRCTYIMLGIVCELSVAAIFSADPSKQARQALHLSLVQALQHVGQILSSALDNRPETLERAEHELGAVLGLDNRIEFLALEIGPHARVGDHARAALAALGSALSRVFGAALQLQGQEDLQSILKTFEAKAPELSEASTNEGLGRGPVGQEAVFSQAQNLLARLEEVTRISDPALFLQAVPELCAQLKTLRQNCLTALKVIVMNIPGKSSDVVTYSSNTPSNELFLAPLAALQVCLTALASVLGDLETAVQQIEASATSAPGDRFRFARVPWHDTVSAWQNGLRAVVAVLFTALVYEVTAWTEGLPYIVYTAVICCVFGPRPQQITATMGYLYGTIAAAFVAFWVVVLGIPSVRTYEPLMLVIGAALMLSFPFRTRPATAAASVTYGFMLLLMCGLDNQHDMNAVQYFNKAMSEVLSSATAVLAFRIVFPFNLLQAAFRVRRSMLQDLHFLVRPGRVMSETRWISRSLDRFAHLATRAEETTLDAGAAQRFLYGVLATLALGLNLLRLRRLMQDQQLPAPFSPVLEQVLHLFGTSRLNVEAALTHISKARQRLAQLAFEQETAAQETAQKTSTRKDDKTALSDDAAPSLPVPRLGVAYALGCLLGIEQLLSENRAFLNSDQSIWSARDVGREKMNM